MTRASYFFGLFLLSPMVTLACTGGEVTLGGDSTVDESETGSRATGGNPSSPTTTGTTTPSVGGSGGANGIAPAAGGNSPAKDTPWTNSGGAAGAPSTSQNPCAEKTCGASCSCDPSQSICNATSGWCGADGTCSTTPPKCSAEPPCTSGTCAKPKLCALHCGSPSTTNNACCDCPVGTVNTEDCPRSTVTEGVKGIVLWSEGDFMPVITPDSSGRQRPISRELRIYSRLQIDDVVVSDRAPTLLSQINGTLVATATSNSEGFYEVALPPGEYSIFAEDQGEWFCNVYNGRTDLCPLTVGARTVSTFDIDLNYQATY